MLSVYRSESDSGHDTVVSRYSSPLHQYDVAYGLQTKAQVSALQTFFFARRGPAYGFRFQDFQDYTTAADHISAPTSVDQNIDVGNGSTVQFQLVKNYNYSGLGFVRTITKPVAGTVSVALNGVTQATNLYDVCLTSGRIWFATAPGNGVVITAGFQFDVPVRFLEDVTTMRYETQSSWVIESIPLLEMGDDRVDLGSQPFVGGAQYLSLAADTTLSVTGSELILAMPTGSGKKIYLPPKATLKEGGPQFRIANLSSTSFAVHDGDTLSSLGSFVSPKIWEFALTKNDSGVIQWDFRAKDVLS